MMTFGWIEADPTNYRLLRHNQVYMMTSLWMQYELMHRNEWDSRWLTHLLCDGGVTEALPESESLVSSC